MVLTSELETIQKSLKSWKINFFKIKDDLHSYRYVLFSAYIDWSIPLKICRFQSEYLVEVLNAEIYIIHKINASQSLKCSRYELATILQDTWTTPGRTSFRGRSSPRKLTWESQVTCFHQSSSLYLQSCPSPIFLAFLLSCWLPISTLITLICTITDIVNLCICISPSRPAGHQARLAWLQAAKNCSTLCIYTNRLPGCRLGFGTGFWGFWAVYIYI